MTGDELLLMINDACDSLSQEGIEPHEIIISDRYEELLRSGCVYMDIPFDKMKLYGLPFRFENLPDEVSFVVSS